MLHRCLARGHCQNFDPLLSAKTIVLETSGACLCRASLAAVPVRVGVREASNMSFISSVKRATYVRQYPTVLVQPDGSTITVRYHEPRSLIKLPLKFEELTPEEQQLVLVKRKPPEVVVIQEELEDNFDSQRYLKFIKKKKK
ncbi:large ribosomal subunit protein mL55-like isoform X1 [Rhipicephalus microplus]|uniref:large ribosomal subunit protein mL55-like isoform X1 n=1 Tax=Rhipicephalus microplus TaxID=6941 RepID=UPI003F6BE65A